MTLNTSLWRKWGRPAERTCLAKERGLHFGTSDNAVVQAWPGCAI